MNILVTGGAGFIGSHLVDRYIADGHDVLVVDDLSTGSRDNVDGRATLEVADIRDADRIRAVVRSFRPELINHLAAQIDVRHSVADPIADAETNILGTLALLRAAVDANVRAVLFASSGGSIYGESPQPAAEDSPKAPSSPYAAAKLAIEAYLLAFAFSYGLPSTALRYGNVYGPRQRPDGEAGVISIFGDLMLRGKAPTVFGDGHQLRDYVFVEDVVGANVLAAGRLLEEPDLDGPLDRRAINIASGRSTSVCDLAKLLASATGYPGPIEHAPARAGELTASRLDITRARRTLGFAPRVDLAAGIKRTVTWLKGSASRD